MLLHFLQNVNIFVITKWSRVHTPDLKEDICYKWVTLTAFAPKWLFRFSFLCPNLISLSLKNIANCRRKKSQFRVVLRKKKSLLPSNYSSKNMNFVERSRLKCKFYQKIANFVNVSQAKRKLIKRSRGKRGFINGLLKTANFAAGSGNNAYFVKRSRIKRVNG